MHINDARLLKKGDTVSINRVQYEILSKGKFYNPATRRPTIGFILKDHYKSYVLYNELDDTKRKRLHKLIKLQNNEQINS